MHRDDELREILSRATPQKDTGSVVFNGPVTIIVNGSGVGIAASGQGQGALERRRAVLAGLPPHEMGNRGV
jgi:hypothetical protein